MQATQHHRPTEQKPPLPPPPPQRKKADRSTTSCGECRRRKQKCNQGQPCSNCKRRFPEPICEYGPRKPDSFTPAFVTPANIASSHSRDKQKLLAPAERQLAAVAPRLTDIAGHHDASTSKQPAIRGPAGRFKPRSWMPGMRTGAAAHFGPDGMIYQCQLAGPVESISHLPVEPTKQNSMLIYTFPELLFRFKGSFDGESDHDNPFITQYVPWCVQSPLLARTSMYISARSLSERGFIDESSTMRLKGQAIAALNDNLRSDNWISDEVMAGVVQFISIEWFFGEPEVVQAHIKGLREMVKLRGGFPALGVGALVTKVALVDDHAIALSLETTPLMAKSPDFNFDYRERPSEHFKIRHTSPMAPSPLPFSSCSEALQLHPATAAILDEMRFLINLAVGEQDDEEPSPEKIRKIRSTATWIHDRMCRLNKDVPGGPTTTTEGPELYSQPISSHSATSPASHQASDPSEPSTKPHSLLPDYPAYTATSSRGTTPSGATLVHGSTASPDPAPDSLSSLPGTPRPAEADAPKDDVVGVAALAVDTEQDSLYVAVRLAATLYSRAVSLRQPFSVVCLPSEAFALLAATWCIPLRRWRGIIGVFLFLLLAIVPTIGRVHGPLKRRKTRRPDKHDSGGADKEDDVEGQTLWGEDDADQEVETDDDCFNDPKEVIATAHIKPHYGFAKSILQIGFMQMAIEDWNLCSETMKRALALQRWLRGDGESSAGSIRKS